MLSEVTLSHRNALNEQCEALRCCKALKMCQSDTRGRTEDLKDSGEILHSVGTNTDRMTEKCSHVHSTTIMQLAVTKLSCNDSRLLSMLWKFRFIEQFELELHYC